MQIQELKSEAAARQDLAARVAEDSNPKSIPTISSAEEKLAVVNRQIRIEAQRAIDGGVVYRSPKFWSQFEDDFYLQSIFDGDFSAMNARSYGFAMFFNAFVVAYSRTCKDHFPAGSAVYIFEQRRQVFDGWGYKTADYAIRRDEIIVKRTLQPFYERFRNHSDSPDIWRSGVLDLFGFRGEATQNLRLGLMESLWWEPMKDFIRFLEQEGCASLPQQQMELNLLRKAAGQPSLQDAGLGFGDVSTVTTPPDRAILAQSELRLAEGIFDELESRRVREGDRELTSTPIENDVVRQFNLPVFLDGETSAIVISTDVGEIGWQEVYEVYNLANAEAVERKSLSPMFFKSSDQVSYVAHVRVGWRDGQNFVKAIKLTFTIRELNCEAFNAGLVGWGPNGPEGDNGFALAVQRHFGGGAFNWSNICNVFLQSTFGEKRNGAMAYSERVEIRRLRELVDAATPRGPKQLNTFED